jgi:hypothetical protein
MFGVCVAIRDIAEQVWQEFSPHDDEALACRDDGIIEVTAGGSVEGFNIDPDQPLGLLASQLADRIQTIIMEERQQMVPDCPLHPGSHPLQSDVVNGIAAWVCPQTNSVIRYMRVTQAKLSPETREHGRVRAVLVRPMRLMWCGDFGPLPGFLPCNAPPVVGEWCPADGARAA